MDQQTKDGIITSGADRAGFYRFLAGVFLWEPTSEQIETMAATAFPTGDDAFDRGASALGTTAGWLLGSQLAAHQALDFTMLFVVSCVMVLALLVVSMLVFNDRAVGMVGERAAQDAHEAAGAVRHSVGNGVDSRAAEEGLGATEAAGDEPQASGQDRAGTWTRSCLDIASRFGLSQRETEVLFLLAKGRTIAFIADDLGVSFNTAKSHIRHVYVKLGVHTKSELLDMVERGRK